MPVHFTFEAKPKFVPFFFPVTSGGEAPPPPIPLPPPLPSPPSPPCDHHPYAVPAQRSKCCQIKHVLCGACLANKILRPFMFIPVKDKKPVYLYFRKKFQFEQSSLNPICLQGENQSSPEDELEGERVRRAEYCIFLQFKSFAILNISRVLRMKYFVYLFDCKPATFCFHFCIHLCKAKGTFSV